MLAVFRKETTMEETHMNADILSILELSDNAFPNADFVKPCKGLETFLKQGQICNKTRFEEFLICALQNAGSFHLPFVRDAHSARITDLVKIDNIQHKCLTSHSANQVSVKQGRSLIYSAKNTFRSPQFDELQSLVDQDVIQGHHATMFGYLCSHLGIAVENTLELFLLGVVRSILATAVKLQNLTSSEAQQIQREVRECFPDIILKNMNREVLNAEVTKHLNVELFKTGLGRKGTFPTAFDNVKQSNPLLLKLLKS